MRQVELIEPRVICTLGNFATKLLRGDPTGISRLHGQAEIRVIGSRAVRLYPLFHPAAALYTRSLLETLRADFARLPGAAGAARCPSSPSRPRRRSRPCPSPRWRSPRLRRSRRTASSACARPDCSIPESGRTAARDSPRARRPDDRQLGLFVDRAADPTPDDRAAQRRQHLLAVRPDRAERVGAADELQADDGRAGALHLADALDVLLGVGRDRESPRWRTPRRSSARRRGAACRPGRRCPRGRARAAASASSGARPRSPSRSSSAQAKPAWKMISPGSRPCSSHASR